MMRRTAPLGYRLAAVERPGGTFHRGNARTSSVSLRNRSGRQLDFDSAILASEYTASSLLSAPSVTAPAVHSIEQRYDAQIRQLQQNLTQERTRLSTAQHNVKTRALGQNGTLEQQVVLAGI